MRILIFSAFDPIPSDEVEIIRYARLAKVFLNLGHQLTYVTSSFFHLKKSKRQAYWEDKSNPKGLILRLLPVPSYRRHIGLKRLISNYKMVLAMKRYLKTLKKDDYPDLIITAAPPLKVNNILIKWARENNIPSVYDIQDLWPDEFMKFFPTWFPARLALRSSFAIARNNIKLANAVTAVSNDYLLHYNSLLNDKPSQVFYLGKDTSNFSHEFIKVHNNVQVAHLGNSQNTNHWGAIIGAISSFPASRLMVIGKESWPASVISQFKQSNNPEVIIKGLLDKNKLDEILIACDCGLILLDENTLSALPNRAFTYWAAGLPVVNNIKGGELEKLIDEHNLGVTIKDTSTEEIQKGIEYCVKQYSLNNRYRIQKTAANFFDSRNIYQDFSEWILNFKDFYH